MECLNSNLKIIGAKSEIKTHLNGGPAKNLTNSVFNYTSDKCDYCGVKKIKQFN